MENDGFVIWRTSKNFFDIFLEIKQMKRKIWFLSGLFLLAYFFIIGCSNNQKSQHFSLKTLPPKVLKENGAEIFLCWEFKNDSFLWETNFFQPLSLKLYKDSLINILGKEKFKQVFQKLALQDTNYILIKTKNGDSINAQLVNSKSLGKIRHINYLEAQLLDFQLSRYPLLSHPTEFHGFILFQDSLKLVKVYFAASDQPWPPKPGLILDKVLDDLKQGWTFKYHLHNHYEPKSNNYIGILAPSTNDAQYYLFLSEEYNLEQSLITNGFHTVEINRTEFPKFELPSNN